MCVKWRLRRWFTVKKRKRQRGDKVNNRLSTQELELLRERRLAEEEKIALISSQNYRLRPYGQLHLLFVFILFLTVNQRHTLALLLQDHFLTGLCWRTKPIQLGAIKGCSPTSFKRFGIFFSAISESIHNSLNQSKLPIEYLTYFYPKVIKAKKMLETKR